MHSENDGYPDNEAIKKVKRGVAIYQNTAPTTDTSTAGTTGTGSMKEFLMKSQSYFKQNLGEKVTQYSVVKSPFSIAGDEEDGDDGDDGDVEINEYQNKASLAGKYGDDLDAYEGDYSQDADQKKFDSDDDDDADDEMELKL